TLVPVSLPSRLLRISFSFFFFNAPPTPHLYTLSLHDALPISATPVPERTVGRHVLEHHHRPGTTAVSRHRAGKKRLATLRHLSRSEEHTSELQSRENLVCRLLLEKKKTN